MTTTDDPRPAAPSEPLDEEALRVKYRAERDKRLRPDGNDQYLEVTGVFAEYAEDPYVEPEPREPLHDEVTVAFIGGGFAGLVTGARLKQAGIDDVRIIEKGGDVGGTWYWNRYPGAQCDTAAFIYLPLLEETGHMPTEKYTHAPEILDHCRRIATHFDLYDGRLSLHRGHRRHLGGGDLPVGDPHQPGRRDAGPVRGHRHRPAAQAQAPRHPRHRDLRRPQLPHQPLGLRLHRRRPGRRPHGPPGRQEGRHHRHRRHVRAVHPPPGQGVRRALRVPAHAVVDRRPEQPPHRPRVVHDPRAGLAAGVAHQLHHPADGGLRRRGPGEGRLDRHRPAHPGQGGGRTRTSPRRGSCGPTTTATTRRWPRSGLASTPSWPTRRRPRPSSPGTASCASGPASTTSTSTPTTSPAPTWSTPTARAWSASTRPACGSTAPTTSSTA